MKILIIGGGIGGLNGALNFAKRGADVELFEQATGFDDSGAGIQLSPNAMYVNRFTGIEAALTATACVRTHTTLRHYRTGKVYYRGADGARGADDAPPYLHIHRADLIASLAEACERHGVKIHLGHSFKSAEMTEGGREVCVTLDIPPPPQNPQAPPPPQNPQAPQAPVKTKTVSGDLLVGADGLHSRVKALMFAKETPRFTPRFTGQIAWRGTVALDKIPASAKTKLKTLLKQKLTKNESAIWLGAGKHFVAYYMRGGAMINFIAVEERPTWTKESWFETGDITQLRQIFSNWDPAIQALLGACEECHIWGLFDHPPLKSWHHGRMVLLGDAAHPMLPFMAQGAAMALEDGYVLAEKICTAQNIAPTIAQNISGALSAYEKTRQPRTRMIQKISSRNAKRFHAKHFWVLGARWLYFKLATKFPSLMARHFNAIYGVDVTAPLPDKER